MKRLAVPPHALPVPPAAAILLASVVLESAAASNFPVNVTFPCAFMSDSAPEEGPAMWRHVAQNQSSSGSSFRPIQDKCQPFPQPVASLPQSTIGFCGVEWDPAHSWHTSSSNPSDAITTSTEADGLFFPGAAATTAGLVAILSCAFASPARIVNVSTQRQGGPGPAHWPADSQQRPPSPEGSQSSGTGVPAHRVVGRMVHSTHLL